MMSETRDLSQGDGASIQPDECVIAETLRREVRDVEEYASICRDICDTQVKDPYLKKGVRSCGCFLSSATRTFYVTPKRVGDWLDGY
ncbi:MAG: hypothetical protein AAGB46_18355 [Verrucomicrobiota bacterium]